MTARYTEGPCASCGKPCDHKYCGPACRYQARKPHIKRSQESCRQKRIREGSEVRELQAALNWRRIDDGSNEGNGHAAGRIYRPDPDTQFSREVAKGNPPPRGSVGAYLPSGRPIGQNLQGE